MSGFEIAGLVLGALPLVISALEHYESSLDPVKAFFQWRDILEKAIRELWVQHTSFEMTLRNLLVDLTSEAELDELLSQPESPLWQSPALNHNLRDRLGAAYDVYNYTIEQIGDHVRTLARHLDIDRVDVVTADDFVAILQANRPISGLQQQGRLKFEFRRRIKLTMRRRDVRQLLNNIKECNERLDLFIAKAEKFGQAVSPQQARKRSKSNFNMPLQQVYSHASHLHQVLSKTWACGNHASHRVHLLLEHRMVRKGSKVKQLQTGGGKNIQGRDRATFTFAFKGTDDSDTANWCLAEVEVLDEPDHPLKAAGVKFHVSPPSGTEEPRLVGSSLEVVQDICSIYNSAGHFCLGFCLDLTSQSVLRGAYPAAQRPICPGNDLVTLEDILFSTHKAWQPFTNEDRYALAITLVASFLQLYKTPWVGDRWTERDIHFFQTPPNAATNNISTIDTTTPSKRIDINHPFVTKTYKSAANPTSSTTTLPSATSIYSAADEQSPSHDDSVNFLTLARILLEIRTSRRIEDLRRSEDMGPNALPNEATDLQTLKRWVQQEKGNLSFAFRDAIKYCMKCFADPDIDFKDLAFRQSVIEGVVVPLLEELHFLREGV